MKWFVTLLGISVAVFGFWFFYTNVWSDGGIDFVSSLLSTRGVLEATFISLIVDLIGLLVVSVGIIIAVHPHIQAR